MTDEFITGPPGQAAPPPSTGPVRGGSATAAAGGSGLTGPGDRRSVFVVNGRDGSAVGAVLDLLRALDLRIIEWEHALAKTGLPNPYVGDVVVAGLTMADAAVVIMTPDDMVRLRDDLLGEDDGASEEEIQGQARPNVYYEAGIADALGRERTIIVEVGRVKSFSDVAGRHVVRYDGSAAKRNAFAERLRTAGLEPNTGGSAWLSAGSSVADSIEAAKHALTQAWRPEVEPPVA